MVLYDRTTMKIVLSYRLRLLDPVTIFSRTSGDLGLFAITDDQRE